MIGIFDSGIGGVTVFKEILKLLPNQDYIYYSDSLNNPYGDYSKGELFRIVDNVVMVLIDKGCKIIVIACNTASTIVGMLREKYPDIVFVATEPAYKMVRDYAYNEKTLVMATKGTIESEKFLNLYHSYNNHQTILLNCSGLAELIEDGNLELINNYLNDILAEFNGVKNVVLGCTHYPLIKDNIKMVLGDVSFFDGSIGVSKELERWVKKLGLIGAGNISFIDSSDDEMKEERFWGILKGL